MSKFGPTLHQRVRNGVLGFSNLFDKPGRSILLSFPLAVIVWKLIWTIPFLGVTGPLPLSRNWPLLALNLFLIIISVIDAHAFLASCVVVLFTASQQTTNVPIFSIFGVNFFTTDIIYIAMIASFVATSLKGEKLGIRWTPEVKWFNAFFLWGIFIILLSLPAFGLRAIGQARGETLMGLYFYYTIAHRSKTRRLRKLLAAFEITTLVILWALLLKILDNPFKTFSASGVWLGNTSGLDVQLSDAQHFLSASESLFLSSVMIAVFITAIRRTKIDKSQSRRQIVLIAVTAVAVIIGQVRTVWVAAGLSICCIPLIIGLRRMKWRRVFQLGGLTVVGAGLAIMVIGRHMEASLSNSAGFISGISTDQSVVWRLLMWHAALKDIIQKPLIGHGFGSIFTADVFGVTYTVIPHNAYLMVLYTQGVVGLLLLAGFVVTLLKRGLKFARLRSRTEEGLEIYILVGILGLSLFFAFAFYFTALFWISAGMLILRMNIIEEGSAVRQLSQSSR